MVCCWRCCDFVYQAEVVPRLFGWQAHQPVSGRSWAFCFEPGAANWPSHEHLVIDQGFHAAHLAVLTFALPGSSVQAMPPKTQHSRPTTSLKLVRPLHPCHCPGNLRPALLPLMERAPKAKASCESNQIFAISFSGDNQSGAVGTAEVPAEETWRKGPGYGLVYGHESPRM